MKQKETKILFGLIILILICGAIILKVRGLAFDLNYEKNNSIELNLGKIVEIREVKELVQDVLGKDMPIEVQYVELYKDTLKITALEITENQKNEIVSKINEKYGTNVNSDSVTIEEKSHTRARDFIKPYIVPFAVVSVFSVVYFMIRYHKLNSLKVIAISASIIIIAQLSLLTSMALTRMPIGILTIPAIISIFMASIYILNEYFKEKLPIKEVKN